jgi:hypothetical protein
MSPQRKEEFLFIIKMVNVATSSYQKVKAVSNRSTDSRDGDDQNSCDNWSRQSFLRGLKGDLSQTISHNLEYSEHD